jgi:hypothetical protein
LATTTAMSWRRLTSRRSRGTLSDASDRLWISLPCDRPGRREVGGHGWLPSCNLCPLGCLACRRAPASCR